MTSGLERHNDAQRAYFRRGEKRRMRPAPSPYLNRHVDMFMRYGGLQPGERVLEVGCGMGRYTFPLAARGLRMEAIDLSPELLARFRAFDDARCDIHLHCGDVMSPSADLEPGFDAVVALFAMHHVHSVEATMTAMARLLRPGGRILLLEPNPYNPLYYLQILFSPGMRWRAERGLLAMRPGRIAAAMRSAGLKRISYARFGFFPPFLTNLRGGPAIERVLERVPLWRSALPFQLFRGDLA